MAYTNGFPASYQQYYPQYSQQQFNSYQGSSNIIWVQGLEAAKAYQIAPGVTLPLWDSDAQVIYLKSCDASGMPSMKIIDYTIRTEPVRKAQNALSPTNSTVVTQQDLDALQNQIDALKQQIDMMGVSNESSLQRDAVKSKPDKSNPKVSAVQTAVSG